MPASPETSWLFSEETLACITRHHPSAFGEGPTLAELAREYGGMAVIANGGLDEPGKAAGVRAADLVALGKPALANRDGPRRAGQGEPMARIKDHEL